MGKRPGTAAVIVLSLALGIGANTLIFSLVNAALFRPLPYRDAERLAVLWFTPENQPNQKTGTNPLGYFTVRDSNRAFESVGAGRLTAAFNVAEDSPSGGGRIRVQGQWFTQGMVDVLGVNPQIGRWPDSQQFETVISHGLWQRLFGGSNDVLGRKLRLDLGVATIVGVMAPGFEVLTPADVWIFQSDDAIRSLLRSPNRLFTLVARLKPGVTLEQAQTEATNLANVLAKENAATHQGWTIRAEPLRDVYFAGIRKPLLVFQGAVVFVLLIACANVAGLLLAETSMRHREFALRAALGSGRARIIKQLLTESVLLAATGGVVGIALAWIGLRFLSDLTAARMPAAAAVTLDMPVLALTLLMCAGSALIFGVLPAVHASRPNVMAVLKEAARGSTSGGARHAFRSGFVVIQVSLALVLLVGAGLMINTFIRLSAVDVGFDTRSLMTFQVPLPRSFYGATDRPTTMAGGMEVGINQRLHVLTEQIRERISRIPGVVSAALTATPPLGGEPRHMELTREGQPAVLAGEHPWAEWYPIGANYFRTLGLPVQRGRDFGAQDTDKGEPVAIIDEAMAASFWPNEDPIGKRIQLNLVYDQSRQIVGIVGNVRQNRYQRVSLPQVYVPRVQLPARMDMTDAQEVLLLNTYIARVSGDPARYAAAMRNAVAQVDPTQTVMNVRTIEEYAELQLTELRQSAALLTTLSSVAVILAVVGVFGIVAHTVSQRTQEIGIRVALGARSSSVLGLVLRQGMLLIGIGAVVGITASLLLSRLIQNFLWGVTPTDPLTFAVVVILLLLIGFAACLAPAQRALRIEPLKALREQ
jgi:putative ABC transport system permease protein